MSKELVKVEGYNRTELGKSQVRKLRRNGRIPANWVSKEGNKLLSLDPKWLGRAYQSEGRKFTLVLEGIEHTVAIKELQLDTLRRKPLHVDIEKV